MSQNGEDPDHLLVLQAGRGDLGAFDLLMEKHKQRLINFAGRTLGDSVEAQDVAQNAFLQAFRQAGRFRFESRFSTWLYTIARNLCHNELRRRRRQRIDLYSCAESEQRESGQRRPLESTRPVNGRDCTFQRELQEKVSQGLASLPEMQRTALLLLQDQELKYEEVAAILGVSASATKSLIHRGRQALKQKLRPYLDGVNSVGLSGRNRAS